MAQHIGVIGMRHGGHMFKDAPIHIGLGRRGGDALKDRSAIRMECNAFFMASHFQECLHLLSAIHEFTNVSLRKPEGRIFGSPAISFNGVVEMSFQFVEIAIGADGGHHSVDTLQNAEHLQ